MEIFVKGDIVVIPFPFSDLSGSKRRPALVLANLPGDDIILCQITSQLSKDKFSIFLPVSKIIKGNLPSDSFIRPSRIFTADKHIIIKKAGEINNELRKQVINSIIEIIG
jgi:mRNA interferase MazF